MTILKLVRLIYQYNTTKLLSCHKRVFQIKEQTYLRLKKFSFVLIYQPGIAAFHYGVSEKTKGLVFLR